MPVIPPLINGLAYGWGDISVVIGGTPITGITAVKYAEKQDKENVYGAGRYPTARGVGRVKCTASITLSVETVTAIIKNNPTGGLNGMAPFPIVVMYQPKGGPIIKDIIMNAEFMEDNRDWKEGDMHKDVTLDLLVSHIVWNKL